jgi:hypothetical protein
VLHDVHPTGEWAAVSAPETVPSPVVAPSPRPARDRPLGAVPLRSARARHGRAASPDAAFRRAFGCALLVLLVVGTANGVLGDLTAWVWKWAGTGLVPASVLAAAGMEAVLT